MAAALVLTSFTVIYYQVALVRLLNFLYSGTFTSLVISLALLGFGAGGTLLALNQDRIRGRETVWLAGFAVLTALGIAAGTLAVIRIPLNMAYLLYDGRQIRKFLAVVLAMLPAFFGGGSLIGLILVSSDRHRGRIYALNLAGSGLGGLAALGAMYRFSPEQLPPAALIPAAGAMAALSGGLSRRRRLGLLALAAAALFAPVVWHPVNRVDDHKDLAAMRRLEAQGEARLLAASNSPSGRLEAYEAASFHYVLFAGLDAPTPPKQIAVYRDGNLIGAPFVGAPVFGAGTAEDPGDGASRDSRPPDRQASLLDRSLPALAYRLTEPRRVLVIGDAGLTGVRTALRAGALEVVLLLPDRHLADFLAVDLAFATDEVLARPEVKLVSADYRRYLAAHSGRFDVIHVAAAESLAVPASGMASTHDDYLLTVEALSAAIGLLEPGGVLSLSRGLQTPPRDNLKLFLTLFEALRQTGAAAPENRLLMARGYLAAANLAFRDPIDAGLSRRFRAVCRDWSLDVEYEPGAGEAPPGHYTFRLPGPEGSGDSWLRYAARLAAAGRSDELTDAWIFDVRPATDARPFFHAFFRWRSLGRFTELFGRYWFRRSDVDSLVLLASLIAVAVLAFLLILLPHLAGGARLRTGFLAYFPAIGLGFMLLEILMIRRAALYLGSPHAGVPIVLAALLASSGAGSLVQERLRRDLKGKIARALPGLVIPAALFLLPPAAVLRGISAMARAGSIWPYLAVMTAVGIPGFFMGWFLAPGLDRLRDLDRSALPIAWALNGFASVAASPLAVLAAMRLGYPGTALLAAGAYSLALVAVLRYSGD